MGTPNKYDPKFCKIATDILSKGKSLAAVCAELDICRDTLYEWRESKPEFKEALARGLQKCQLYWEEMGIKGTAGKLKGFSAPAFIFTLKNRFREDYAEQKEEKSEATSLLEKIISGELKIKHD